jgi:hypothetical protein
LRNLCFWVSAAYMSASLFKVRTPFPSNVLRSRSKAKFDVMIGKRIGKPTNDETLDVRARATFTLRGPNTVRGTDTQYRRRAALAGQAARSPAGRRRTGASRKSLAPSAVSAGHSGGGQSSLACRATTAAQQPPASRCG